MINPYFILFVVCSLVSCSITRAQSLSLEESHILAMENYPMVKQRNLIGQSAAYSIEKANTAYLPQLTVNGQATYQSDVTQIPIQLPGMDIPKLSRDQYKLYGEVNQHLYDGGMTRLHKEAFEANAEIDKQALDVELYKIKERVNQLFFGILLLDAQLSQNGLLKRDIQAGLDKTKAAITNGTALKSSASLLEAELLKAEQRTIELQATRKAYLQMLGLFINQPLDEHTTLEKPAAPTAVPIEINRPELEWYAQQQRGIAIENRILTAKNLPKLNLFLQGGIGRPALNMLSNDFEPYYYGGLRLSFPLNGLYTLKKERALLTVRQKAIDVQKETFLFNTHLLLSQQNAEITKYRKLLETDEQIIALRTSVKKAALAQLENGVINTADFIREVNAEDAAQLTKILHEVQWISAYYNLEHTSGN